MPTRWRICSTMGLAEAYHHIVLQQTRWLVTGRQRKARRDTPGQSPSRFARLRTGCVWGGSEGRSRSRDKEHPPARKVPTPPNPTPPQGECGKKEKGPARLAHAGPVYGGNHTNPGRPRTPKSMQGACRGGATEIAPHHDRTAGEPRFDPCQPPWTSDERSANREKSGRPTRRGRADRCGREGVCG
jgi:hypothetical protein